MSFESKKRVEWEDFALHFGDKIKCKECGEEFKIYSEFDRHVLKKHDIITVAGLGIRRNKSE